MSLYQNKYRVESHRLPGRDYSLPGFYFITTNIKDHRISLGKIVDGKMDRNAFGDIIFDCWNDLPNHYPHMSCDAFVVMPDHIHCIIQLHEHDHVVVETGLRPVSTTTTPKPPAPVSEIMRALKSFSARRINILRESAGRPVWQPRFYDRVIRDKYELLRVRQYILNNPMKWNKEP